MLFVTGIHWRTAAAVQGQALKRLAPAVQNCELVNPADLSTGAD